MGEGDWILPICPKPMGYDLVRWSRAAFFQATSQTPFESWRCLASGTKAATDRVSEIAACVGGHWLSLCANVSRVVVVWNSLDWAVVDQGGQRPREIGLRFIRLSDS